MTTIKLAGILTKRIKRTDTRDIVKAAKESVLGFAVKNKRLPTTAEFAAQVKNTDAWTKTLFYYNDSNLETGNACYSSSTGFQIEDECITGVSCATFPSPACCKTGSAFIILSTGENGTNETGTAPIFTILEQGDTYDDITAYGLITELKNNVLACAGLEIQTTTLPNATEDAYYTTTLIGRGGSAPTWAVSGQTINTLGCSGSSYPLTNPNTADLCLAESTGIISGTVNYSGGATGTLAACTQTASFTATLTQTGLTAVSKAFTITLNPQTLGITTQTLPDARTGVAYSVTLQGTGGRASYTWSLDSGALPSGLSLSSGGVISGTPDDAAGAYNFIVELADTCTTTTKAYTLNLIDSCASPGINIRNSRGGTRYYRRSGVGCTAWANNAGINVQQIDTMEFFTNNTCTTERCTSQTMTYNFFQGYDTDDDCSIRWTGEGGSCTFSDL
ncbi:MAG: putative Ig domain-containing protein [Nitrospirae bacterium]|nr:putative Ig domain-containing protein [Nitrospirota bacterium]